MKVRLRHARKPVAALILLIGVAACGGGSDDGITKSTFKGDWPLTVDSATIACGAKNKQSVGVKVNGTTYALNGTAKTFEKWPGLEPVWAPDPSTGASVSVGDLIDYGQEYCAKKG